MSRRPARLPSPSSPTIPAGDRLRGSPLVLSPCTGPCAHVAVLAAALPCVEHRSSNLAVVPCSSSSRSFREQRGTSPSTFSSGLQEFPGPKPGPKCQTLSHHPLANSAFPFASCLVARRDLNSRPSCYEPTSYQAAHRANSTYLGHPLSSALPFIPVSPPGPSVAPQRPPGFRVSRKQRQPTGCAFAPRKSRSSRECGFARHVGCFISKDALRVTPYAAPGMRSAPPPRAFGSRALFGLQSCHPRRFAHRCHVIDLSPTGC